MKETGNKMLDQMIMLNENILLLNSKIDKLVMSSDKIEENTKMSIAQIEPKEVIV